MVRIFRFLLMLMVLAGVVAGGYTLYQTYGASTTVMNYQTAPVERGELLVAVGATGTLEPEDMVDVGAQVVGRVKELGIDARGETEPRYAGKTVDYRSLVKKGQMLALIDESVYLAQRNQAQAALDHSKADLLQLEARLKQAEAEWVRAEKLISLKVSGFSPTGARSGEKAIEIKGITDADWVLARSNFEAASANVEVGKAVIDQNSASLQLAETNLSYTTISSPVDGTVIDRRVNIGQTVVSSMNAPSLFLIAKDLRKMQVWASVNEADIGLIKIDMPVRFTVDAFPDDVFEGTVFQVRLNATMTQNVVTYTVVIANDNSDLKLLPFLTADVKFIIERHEDSLLVPNRALRYQPRPEQILPGAAVPEVAESDSKKVKSEGLAWVRSGDFVKPVLVTIKGTDGSMTAIEGDGLLENVEVVLGEEIQVVANEEVNNPFAPPKFPRRSANAKKKK